MLRFGIYKKHRGLQLEGLRIPAMDGGLHHQSVHDS